jgi:prepilin peptidase CpaA
MIEAAILVVFPFAMAFAAVSDFLSMTIQNRVPLVLTGAFLLLAPLTGMAWPVFGLHVVAGLIVLVVGFGLFAIRAMGGGDAKLLAATALWMGLGTSFLYYFVLASVIGGGLTLLLLSYRKSPISVFAGRLEFLRRLGDGEEGIPYGVALGVAGLMTFPQTELGLWAIGRLAGH